MQQINNHSQGNSQGCSSPAADPVMRIVLDTFRAVKASGVYYFFVGGGSHSSEDKISEKISESNLANEQLLREIPWSFGDIQTLDTAVMSVAHGRLRSSRGGGDVFLVCTAFPYGDKQDPRMIALSCEVKDGTSLEHIQRRISLSPMTLQDVLGVFDDRFARGELLLSNKLKISIVPGTISYNQNNEMTEYRRGSSKPDYL